METVLHTTSVMNFIYFHFNIIKLGTYSNWSNAHVRERNPIHQQRLKVFKPKYVKLHVDKYEAFNWIMAGIFTDLPLT